MSAPTFGPAGDDDLRYPANQANPFLDDAAETVPVSELMKQVPQQGADDPELAPLRVDVSLAVFAAVWVGMVAGQTADRVPGSSGIAYLGALIAGLLLIRWTRKR